MDNNCSSPNDCSSYVVGVEPTKDTCCRRSAMADLLYLLEHLFWYEQLLQVHILLQLVQVVYVAHLSAELDAVGHGRI